MGKVGDGGADGRGARVRGGRVLVDETDGFEEVIEPVVGGLVGVVVGDLWR